MKLRFSQENEGLTATCDAWHLARNATCGSPGEKIFPRPGCRLAHEWEKRLMRMNGA
jgi:hypothetical protein